jgi:hypothetical protein
MRSIIRINIAQSYMAELTPSGDYALHNPSSLQASDSWGLCLAHRHGAGDFRGSGAMLYLIDCMLPRVMSSRAQVCRIDTTMCRVDPLG